jgi:hypothetical protein
MGKRKEKPESCLWVVEYRRVGSRTWERCGGFPH